MNVHHKYKSLGIIPARFRSSRFEGKPLAKINGVPMIKRTFNQAKKSKSLSDLVVATDDQRIFDFCKVNDMAVIMTSESCKTGTDRVAEVSCLMPDYDLYINIQGDEPVIDPVAVDQVIEAYKEYGDSYYAYNLYKKIEDSSETSSNTIIKVIFNESGELMYMSRLPVPYNQAQKNLSVHYKQVCVYAFTKEALKIFSLHPKTHNESYEEIEILRFVELGYKVKMIETNVDSIAVDIPSDILKVEKYLKENNFQNDKL